MGAIADAIVAYAQPLIDATDGSQEAISDALVISQYCWNVALLSKEEREEVLRDIGPDVEAYVEDFDAFQESVLIPLIRRHEEMFPQLHGRSSTHLFPAYPPYPSHPTNAAPKERYPGTEPYAPCPCNSGRKYKFCCRPKRR